MLRPTAPSPRAAAWIALTLLTLGTPASAEISIGLTPLRDVMSIVPGSPLTDAVTVNNPGEDPIHVKAHVVDWTLRRDGNVTFIPLSTDPDAAAPSERSVARWLRVNPPEFDLTGGQEQIVRYTLTPAADLSPGSYHAAVVFVASTRVRAVRNTAARGGISAFLYFVVGEPHAQAEFMNMAAVTAEDGTPQVSLALRNAGPYVFRTAGSVSIWDANGQEVGRENLPSVPVLPELARSIVIPFESKLEQGSYTVEAEIDVGDPTLLIGETSFVVATNAEP